MKQFLLALLFCINVNAQNRSPIEYIFDSTKSEDLKAYLFYPDEMKGIKENSPAMIIFHGGGWDMGDATWSFNTARKYANKCIVTVAAQYRISDQKKITPIDAMEDARNLIIWVRKNAEELKIDKDKIVAYGWSAGAHLASCAAVFPTTDSLTNLTSIPNVLILKSPALSLSDDSWFKTLLGDGTNASDYSPAEHIKENMPPSIILVGKYDTVTPVWESKLFHENMLKYGNESYLHIYDNVGHLFTPKDLPDDGMPNPDKKTQIKADCEVDQFLRKLGYLEF